MKNSSRYSVSSEENYEPGSNDQVLKNYLDIKSSDIMDQLEARELKRAELETIDIFDENHRITAQDICDIHYLWLGDIYPFAGKYRTVNLEKDGFLFARSDFIQKLMGEFETEYLAKYTPCHFSNIDELAYALAVVHVEFIVIHPFREGNGRIGRLLATLMALQARKPFLDFNEIDQITNLAGFKNYILAIHAGHAGNYKPMQVIFQKILKASN